MTLRYLDVCAGISASTVAWAPLGWRAAAYSEIEPAPRAILAHHYPHVPLHGDFTTIRGDEYGPIDLLVGGTPCQDFSVAGLRAGLGGERGNLSLEYLRLADRARPRWLVWENVPGVLSQDGGRAFGAILGGMGELGYGFAYRVLDAQFCGVPQRRRRVFVVGYLGDWRRAGAVLLERHGLSGHPAPRREAREGVTDRAPFGPPGEGGRAGRPANGRTGAQAYGGGANCQPTDVATAVAAHPGDRYDHEVETFVAGTLGANGKAAGSATQQDAESGLLVPVPFDTTQITSAANYSSPKPGDPCHPLAAGAHAPAIAFDVDNSAGAPCSEGSWGTLSTKRSFGVASATAVRRLTPRECERLQGFPDDYTLIPYRKGMMADGPRYKALGNSMAVPVMRWIGERIAMVERIT